MATEPQDYSAKRRKRKPKAKNSAFVLLILMIAIACISGVVAYILGRQALQVVNPIPLGGIPKQVVPTEKPTAKPTAKPSKPDKTSFVDDRQRITRSQGDVILRLKSIADTDRIVGMVLPIA